MGGQPVWLASASLRDGHDSPRLSEEWVDDRASRRRVERALERTLQGVGDASRQRLFRMPITVCLHRALTDEEVDALPEVWHDLPAEHLAGGGLEILWETEEGALSTKPCENPTRLPANPLVPKLYTIDDCGECGPCLAREASTQEEP